MTQASSWVWWVFYTVVVLTATIMTFNLDGFFGSAKNEETLSLGISGCTAGLMGGLGYGTYGDATLSPGLPRLDYIENTPAMEDVVNGGRSRRSVDVFDRGTGNIIYGANVTGAGPVKPEKDCVQLLKDYHKAFEKNQEAASEYWEDSANKPMQTMMCMALTYAPASTCITHPNLQVDDDATDATTAGPGKYKGFQTRTEGAGVISELVQVIIDADTDANDVTLKAHRAEKDFIPCEQRTREECYKTEEWHGLGFQRAQKQPMCVSTNVRPTPDGTASNSVTRNFYKVANVKYLVDKTDLTVDEALCRYAGKNTDASVADQQCKSWYELERFGHTSGSEGDHSGYTFNGATYLADQLLNERPNYKAEDEFDKKPVVPEENDGEGEGGQFWARVGTQDSYIRETFDGLGKHQLMKADLEFIAAFSASAFARKLSNEDRYNNKVQNHDYHKDAPDAAGGGGVRRARRSNVDLDTELDDDQKDNRAALLGALPGECFGPGISTHLLYQSGWGAAYFSLVILLVVAHLVWLAAAIMGDGMDMTRINAKRAMSFLGILVALIGLYILFFIYGSGQGAIMNDDELRRWSQMLAGGNTDHDQSLATGFLRRLNHGRLDVYNSDSFTSTATIQALEALHFVIFGFAVITPLFGKGFGVESPEGSNWLVMSSKA